MLNHATQSGRHANSDRGLDLYETPTVAVDALLRTVNLPFDIWEPAAGRGAIVNALRDRGYRIVASDIHDYGFPLDFRRDFLTVTKAPDNVEAITTNPPFRWATQFVAHALQLVPTVGMLARLAFLESERRAPVLDSGQLVRVLVFKERLAMMHRDGWTGRRASSAIAFAWFIFDRIHVGPACNRAHLMEAA